ncbi:MAG: CZB domain-containing protein [Desulfobulbaceae bacterium]|nr:CZB domain-containing protein [Desulfobulbaceae bacterium]
MNILLFCGLTILCGGGLFFFNSLYSKRLNKQTSQPNALKAEDILHEEPPTACNSPEDSCACAHETAAPEFENKPPTTLLALQGNISTLDSTSGAMSTASDELTEDAKSLFELTNGVAGAAEKMSTNMNAIASAMEQSSTNVTTVAAAAEQMTVTINEIADNTEEARSITDDAVAQARQASISVSKLGETAQKITMVTDTITEISDQTNLLALNATIEAARAGDAGKGFAVVANEVKELAKQTKESTKDIMQQIADMQHSAMQTVEVINNITSTIDTVSKLVATIASAVEQQAFASADISTNISQASTGMREVKENITQASEVNLQVAGDIVTVRDTSDQITNRCLEVREFAHELKKLAHFMDMSISNESSATPLFDIGAVKTAHLNWKINLEAVLEGRKKMEADKVVDHHNCVFGKWYDSAQGEFTNSPIFKAIDVHHKAVHATAREIISLYNQNKPEAAQARMTNFEKARMELFRLLDELYVS